uniref:2-phosphoxylose phosphatase 1 n=1 Tax=Macrostomum lignano TaxID=282301 RepID=A0A1I8JS67_9PLAT
TLRESPLQHTGESAKSQHTVTSPGNPPQHTVKSGPFEEHSQHAARHQRGCTPWDKVNSGLVKMYKAEILAKFPIIQHFYFGELLPLKPASEFQRPHLSSSATLILILPTLLTHSRRMSQPAVADPPHKLLSAMLAGTLAADAAYYGLHNLTQSYRAYRCACTQQGSSEMLASRSGQAGHSSRPALTTAQPVRRPRRRPRCASARLSASQGFQAFLGLPQHFGYSASDKEQRHRGRELYRDCLLLNEDELGFALARELAYLNSYAVHVPPAVGTLAASGVIGTTFWFTRGSGRQFVDNLLKGRPTVSDLLRRNLLLSALVAASTSLWAVMAYSGTPRTAKSLDARVDKRAAAAYPRGGASFYQKQVRRNTLLRAMLGDSIGKKYFTVRGNEVHNWVLSDPFLPVNQRWSKLRYDQSLAASAASSSSAAPSRPASVSASRTSPLPTPPRRRLATTAACCRSQLPSGWCCRQTTHAEISRSGVLTAAIALCHVDAVRQAPGGGEVPVVRLAALDDQPVEGPAMRHEAAPGQLGGRRRRQGQDQNRPVPGVAQSHPVRRVVVGQKRQLAQVPPAQLSTMLSVSIHRLLLLLCALVGMATTELVHVSVLFRHGHRSPVQLLPSQNFTVDNYWKDGLGELTNIGKMNEFNLGQFLRKRLRRLPGPSLQLSAHYVRSTDFDRTLMSGLSACLAGLSPQLEISAGTRSYHGNQSRCTRYRRLRITCWRPPISPCPERERQFKQVNADPARLQFYRPYADFLKRLSAGAGMAVTPCLLLDTLWINKVEGLPAPAWLNYSGPDWQRLVTVGSFQWNEYSWTPDLVRFGSGRLLDEILGTIDNISHGRLPD